MNAALKICQAMHDAQLPPMVSESAQEVARAEWLYNATEQLVRFGCDVSLQRRMRPAQGVTLAQFALAVDEHANGRLADCEVTTASLGFLLIAAERGHADKVAAAIKRTAELPEVKKRIEDTGSLLVLNTPDEFAAQIRAELDVYKKVVEKQKLTLD